MAGFDMIRRYQDVLVAIRPFRSVVSSLIVDLDPVGVARWRVCLERRPDVEPYYLCAEGKPTTASAKIDRRRIFDFTVSKQHSYDEAVLSRLTTEQRLELLIEILVGAVLIPREISPAAQPLADTVVPGVS